MGEQVVWWFGKGFVHVPWGRLLLRTYSPFGSLGDGTRWNGLGWDGTRRVGSNKRQIYSSSPARSMREASRQRKCYLQQQAVAVLIKTRRDSFASIFVVAPILAASSRLPKTFTSIVFITSIVLLVFTWLKTLDSIPDTFVPILSRVS